MTQERKTRQTTQETQNSDEALSIERVWLLMKLYQKGSMEESELSDDDKKNMDRLVSESLVVREIKSSSEKGYECAYRLSNPPTRIASLD